MQNTVVILRVVRVSPDGRTIHASAVSGTPDFTGATGATVGGVAVLPVLCTPRVAPGTPNMYSFTAKHAEDARRLTIGSEVELCAICTGPWDAQLYRTELERLVAEAYARWTAEARPPVYTISLWTDPDAAMSSLSIDTLSHSSSVVSEANAYNAQQRAYWLDRGDAAMAELFGAITRNCNPADFDHRDVCTVRHASFADDWEIRSDGACWDVLEPLLEVVGRVAAARFAHVEHASDAIVGVNGRHDWFQTELPVGNLQVRR